MKTKTSVTLSANLLVELDRLIGEKASRSAFIEKVLRDYLRDAARHALQMRDKELINGHAYELNAEMEDVLEYQAPFL